MLCATIIRSIVTGVSGRFGALLSVILTYGVFRVATLTVIHSITNSYRVRRNYISGVGRPCYITTGVFARCCCWVLLLEGIVDLTPPIALSCDAFHTSTLPGKYMMGLIGLFLKLSSVSSLTWVSNG